MQPNEFTKFEDATPMKNKHIVVTNNIEAKNAHGEMSHVWMVNHCFESSKKIDGIVAYDAADRRLVNLTHWKYA